MTICWFGIYDPNFSRNKIYISGLREKGIDIIECRDVSPGPLKYLKLFFKLRKLKGRYDFLWVGYPGYPAVWLGKLVSNKPVVFDALCTLEEGVIISRGQSGFLSLKKFYTKFLDWFAVRCADLILLETDAQKKYYIKKFGEDKRYETVYIGASAAFHLDPKIAKRERFTVLFRGQFLPEAGAKYVVESAKILENEEIDFWLIGGGFLLKEIERYVDALKPKNLRLMTRKFSQDELRELMLSCHVSLGQLADHERLERTIPHKCYESIAMGIPYIHAKFAPVAEILKEGESVIFVNPADPKDLAEKIVHLKSNPQIAHRMGEKGREAYLQRFTPLKLAESIISILRGFKNES